MKTWVTCMFLLLMPLPALAATGSDDLSTAKAEILPHFEAMQAAAKAHDAEKHVSYYARDPDLLFVFNDRAIVGYDGLLKQQREWWQDGKSDVIYTMVGEPEYRMPAKGLVMQTYFLTAPRTMATGTTRITRFSISALWQRRPEGWRIIYAHESTVTQ
jgi:ketosteroid isomerase-like protein